MGSNRTAWHRIDAGVDATEDLVAKARMSVRARPLLGRVTTVRYDGACSHDCALALVDAVRRLPVDAGRSSASNAVDGWVIKPPSPLAPVREGSVEEWWVPLPPPAAASAPAPAPTLSRAPAASTPTGHLSVTAVIVQPGCLMCAPPGAPCHTAPTERSRDARGPKPPPVKPPELQPPAGTSCSAKTPGKTAREADGEPVVAAPTAPPASWPGRHDRD